jgi:hypothetical protein
LDPVFFSLPYMGTRTFTGIELEYAYLRTGISNICKVNCNTELLGIYYVETCIEGLFFRFGLLAIEAKNFQDTTTAKEKKEKKTFLQEKQKQKQSALHLLGTETSHLYANMDYIINQTEQAPSPNCVSADWRGINAS